MLMHLFRINYFFLNLNSNFEYFISTSKIKFKERFNNLKDGIVSHSIFVFLSHAFKHEIKKAINFEFWELTTLLNKANIMEK